MYIMYKKPIHYWNYYLSIEEELINTSKYVEFDLENKDTFSVEYTKIILAASSEVEVLLSQICKMIGMRKNKPKFGDLFDTINGKVKTLMTESLMLEQYAIELKPFDSWIKEEELCWHKTYNNLKHDRGEHYKDGNLENALLSVSALYTSVIHYYKYLAQDKNREKEVRISDVTNSLTPQSKLIKYIDEKNHWNIIN